jgi:hypothetical protein
MRRAGWIALVMVLVAMPAALVLSLAKWPSDAPVSVPPTTIFLPPMLDKTWKNFQPQLPVTKAQSHPEPLEEPQPEQRAMHVHRIPANFDPTDDAVLATTIDTRFRHLGPVLARAMSPCGNRIAAVCEAEGVIREWDVCSGEEVRQFKLPDVEKDERLDEIFAPVPRLLYRAEAKRLLYCSSTGRITTFSTDDTRMLVTYRSNFSVRLSDNGQYHLQSHGTDTTTVVDTGTGEAAGSIHNREHDGHDVRSLSVDGRVAVFTRGKSFRFIHWNPDGPNKVMTLFVPEVHEQSVLQIQWLDAHHLVIPVVHETSKYAVIDVRSDPPQAPVFLSNVFKILGLQDGLLHGLDHMSKPVVFDGASLKQHDGPVRPYIPAVTDVLGGNEGIDSESPLAVSCACLEHPNLNDDGSTRFQQLAMQNGSTVDLVEFDSKRNEANHIDFPQLVVTPRGKFGLLEMNRSTRLYAYPGYRQLPDIEPPLFKDRSGIALLGITPEGTVWVPITNNRGDGYDCYEIAIPSGELIQKREGNQYLSLDGRWLFSTDKQKLQISNAKLGSKHKYVEDFSTRPFIKRGDPGFAFNLGRFDDSESSDRNPDDIYVTTDGRVFGIRNGMGDEIPRTTITVRHVDHPNWKYLTHYQLPGTGTISDQYTVSFHPNERLLFVVLQNPHTIESELRCYEMATLREVFRYWHPRGVSSVKFDRSGQKILLNHKDDAQSVYDFAKFFARQLKPADAKHWLSDDPALAIPAMRALAKQLDAVDVVQTALKQPKPDIATDLLALGHANFRSREAATERLRLLGDDIAVELKATLDTSTEAEVQQRLQGLVRAAMPIYGLTRQQFRVLRAKEVLELAGTPEAKKLLDELK